MNINKLNNDQINTWVAKAQGWTLNNSEEYSYWMMPDDGTIYLSDYEPANDWDQAIKLLLTHRVSLISSPLKDSPPIWTAVIEVTGRTVTCIREDDKDPKRAICLVVIATRFGDEVDE